MPFHLRTASYDSVLSLASSPIIHRRSTSFYTAWKDPNFISNLKVGQVALAAIKNGNSENLDDQLTPDFLDIPGSDSDALEKVAFTPILLEEDEFDLNEKPIEPLNFKLGKMALVPRLLGNFLGKPDIRLTNEEYDKRLKQKRNAAMAKTALLCTVGLAPILISSVFYGVYDLCKSIKGNNYDISENQEKIKSIMRTTSTINAKLKELESKNPESSNSKITNLISKLEELEDNLNDLEIEKTKILRKRRFVTVFEKNATYRGLQLSLKQARHFYGNVKKRRSIKFQEKTFSRESRKRVMYTKKLPVKMQLAMIRKAS